MGRQKKQPDIWAEYEIHCKEDNCEFFQPHPISGIRRCVRDMEGYQYADDFYKDCPKHVRRKKIRGGS